MQRNAVTKCRALISSWNIMKQFNVSGFILLNQCLAVITRAEPPSRPKVTVEDLLRDGPSTFHELERVFAVFELNASAQTLKRLWVEIEAELQMPPLAGNSKAVKMAEELMEELRTNSRLNFFCFCQIRRLCATPNHGLVGKASLTASPILVMTL